MFSIVLPIYNIKEEYLHECMESLLLQTYKGYEIILVNDGSNNGCSKWCDEYAGKYPGIVYVIHKQNEGVSEARNTGIDVAKGDYIIFVDPDDWVETNMCEILHSLLEKEEVDIINLSYSTEYKDSSVEHEVNNQIIRITKEQKREMLLKLIDTTDKLEYKFYSGEIFGSVWGKCYKTSFLRENNIRFERSLIKAQDTVFNLYAFDKAQKVIDYKQIIYHYRMVESSITHRYNKKIFDIQERFLKEVNRFLNTHRTDERFREAFEHRIIQSYFSILDLDVFNSENPKDKRNRCYHWKSICNSEFFNEINYSIISKYSFKSRLVMMGTKYSLFGFLNVIYKLRNAKRKDTQLLFE